MIPDHIINKALDAWIGDHNRLHPDLIDMHRVRITRSLEAVAADIWEDGYDAGSDDERAHHLGVSLIDINQHTPNPYRASED